MEDIYQITSKRYLSKTKGEKLKVTKKLPQQQQNHNCAKFKSTLHVTYLYQGNFPPRKVSLTTEDTGLEL